MNRTVTVLLGIVLATATASAQSGRKSSPDRSAAEKQLIDDEYALNDTFVKNDPKGFYALVDRNGIDVNSNGASRSGDVENAFGTVKISTWKMDDTHVVWIDANTAVVYYRMTVSGVFQGQPLPSPIHVSTVWTKKAGKWIARFHQETVAETPKK